ncbi:MAG: hypothetical protein AB7F31_07030 [Parachlamydiales bacterium]
MENDTDFRAASLALVGATGALAACVYQLTGVGTALHEIVGHAFLGGYLMRHYGPGESPEWQIDGWDNFRAIFRASSVQEGAVATFHWLTGHDANGDGASGVAWVEGGTPNSLAQWMGRDGLSAWTSAAGSLPDLALDSAASVGGIHLMERAPHLASFLIGFALTNHLITSLYPLSAALMSAKELAEAARSGHDFANFAYRIGKITGMEATRVAKLTALCWSLSLPTLIAYTLLSKYSHPKYCVTDEQAEEALHNEGKLGPFTDYELDQARSKLYHEWRGKRTSPKLYRVLKWFTMGRLTLSIAAKYGGILSLSALPSLRPYATALKALVPLMGSAAIAAKGLRCYADYHEPETRVTQNAKKISALDFAFTTAIALGLFRGMWGNHTKTFALSLIASSLKPLVIGHLRLREERVAFAHSQNT